MGQTGLTPCFFFEFLSFTLIFSTCMSDGAKDLLLHLMAVHQRLIYW